jgi:FkbM family methyltransferase
LVDAALIAYARSFEHPAKVRIVRWIARRLVSGRVRVRYAQGAMIAVDPADYIGWSIFKTGYYEPASLNLALRILDEEPGLFVDVGANFGWYTCAVAALAGSRVISIEPDCENCASLRANIALNELRNVIVFNGAVGVNLEPVQIARRAPTNAGTIRIITGDAELRWGNWVAMIPLEALLTRIVRPPTRPILMKIDVEGFEPQVLAGLDFDGPFRPKNILMEFDRELSTGAWGSLGNLRAFFDTKKYDLFNVFGDPLHDDATLAEANVWARQQSR